MIVFSAVPYNVVKNIGLEFDLVYNLSAYIEGYEQINLTQLAPLNYANDVDTFDRVYLRSIYINDWSFMELMSKIVLPEYEGKKVFIMVSNMDHLQIITEAIIKLLQERYYIISNIVNDIIDLECISDYESFKNNLALLNLEEDSNRWKAILSNNTLML